MTAQYFRKLTCLLKIKLLKRKTHNGTRRNCRRSNYLIKLKQKTNNSHKFYFQIPVFLSKSLLNKVFVFQYPIKNVVNCTTKPKIVNCLVKPISQKVKVEFSLNTASRNYDAFKGDQLAIAADGKSQSKNEKPTYLSGTMDKQTLVSTTPLDDINKYIVGIMQDNEIHGSVVKGIVQMRPNFSYFDKLDKRKKAEQNAENTADMDEVELKQVTVKFARTENEKSKKAREKSYDYISQQTADEPWCEALWHDSDTSTAVLEKQKLIVTNNETSERFLSLPSREYIGSLIANDTKQKNFEETLRNSPLLNQIKSLLIEAKALSFHQLMELLPDKTITTEKVLRVLPLAGILIQGNWVPLSEILYPPETFSEINGVSSELMCRGRDYIVRFFFCII